jgi:pyruvate kinase
MLSEETAIGEFPVDAVNIMSETIKEAERNLIHKHEDFELMENNETALSKKSLVKH